MEILFAQIDAKDFDVITINYQRERSKHNTIVMIKARKTYLKKLYKLQQSINNEFGPQLEDDSHIPENESYRYSEEYDKHWHEEPRETREISNLYYT
jgi:hypothetical protein